MKKKCPECGESMQDGARRCPKCGAVLNLQARKFWVYVFAAVLLGVVVYFGATR